MPSAGKDDNFMSEINVTPFVDVMLVLLIIFMVTAPMMTQGVDVSLPEASTGPISKNTEKDLVITIDKTGQVSIDSQVIQVDFFQDKLKEILSGRSEQKVLLRADRNVAYGIVVKVMAEIRGAGVQKIGMVTKPLEESGN